MADLPFRRVLGLNEQSYQRLRVALSLNLRRQVFIAVCDDLTLRDRLSNRLLKELSPQDSPTYPRLVSLTIDFNDPNPIPQITRWLAQSPIPGGGKRSTMPAFQFLGVEHLTRQPAVVQRLFFSHLQGIDRSLSQLESALLFWMPRPWFQSLPQSAPEFWRCRTAVFEFVGDPTPSGTGEAATRPPIATPQERLSPPPSVQEPSQSMRPVDPIEELDIAPSLPEDNGWFPSDPEPPLPENGLSSDNADSVEQVPALVIAGKTTPPSTVNASLHGVSSSAVKKRFKKRTAPVPSHGNGSSHRSNQPAQRHRPASPGQQEEGMQGATATRPANGTPIARVAAIALNQAPSGSPSEAPLEASTATAPALPQSAIDEIDILPQEEGAFFLSLPLVEEALPSEEQQQADFLLYEVERLQQQQAPPDVLAEAYRRLGNLYRDRIEQGELSPSSLEIAVQAYEQVLVWLPERSPLWSDVLNDLGNLYWMQSRRTTDSGEAQGRLQRSIQAYQAALAKLDRSIQEEAYPMIQNNLGAAYADLSRYQEPATNLQRSIEAYQEALRYRTAERDPQRYASTQNNLGTTYWNLAQYERPREYIKEAIAAYSEALHYYRPEGDALNYAMIQNNLGTAYWNLSQHEQPLDWLRLAISAYQIALRYRTLAAAPAAYAATQNNLGTAYWHVATLLKDNAPKRADYLRQAIQAYTAAIAAANQLAEQPYAMPLNFDLFATCNNLGLAQYQLATDTKLTLDGHERETYLHAALQNHLQAFQGWQQKPEFRQTALSSMTQTIRAIYAQSGLSGQNRALSLVPAALLPELLPQLG